MKNESDGETVFVSECGVSCFLNTEGCVDKVRRSQSSSYDRITFPSSPLQNGANYTLL